MEASKLDAGQNKSDYYYTVVKTDNSNSPSFIEISIDTTTARAPATHTTQYSKLSEKIRSFSSSHHLAHSFQCAAFCGGVECKYENPVKWGIAEGVAFKGLYCHWITESVLAMARPSTSLFNEYNILKQFIDAGINAVINLQTPGEHAQCGPGLESSGFTYNPEALMKNNIFFYNYPWPDYGAPTLSAILDVVKVVDFSCSEGKVAIHCHAGLGRTGVVIACYLLYSQRLTPDEVITIVRQKRPDSIQTRGQLELIQSFYNHLCSLWRLYPPTTINLMDYLQRQSNLLHGDEEKKYRYIPKVISLLCERLKVLSTNKTFQFHYTELHTAVENNGEQNNTLEGQSTCCLNNSTGCHCNNHLLQSLLLTCDCCHSDIITAAVRNIKNQINTNWKWSLLEEECDPIVIFVLLYNFFNSLTQPLISTCNHHSITDFWQSLNKQQSAILILVLDTIKTIVNDFDLVDNIELISNHLVKVLFNEDGKTDYQESQHISIVSPKRILVQYLNTN